MIQNHVSQSRFNRCPLLSRQLIVILVVAFCTLTQFSVSVYATGQNPASLVRAIWLKEGGDYYFKTEEEQEPYTIYKAYTGGTYTIRFDLVLREWMESYWTSWDWLPHGYCGCDLREPAGTWSSTGGCTKVGGEGLWADYEFEDPGHYTVTGHHRGYDCSGNDITGGDVTVHIYVIKVEFSESSANSGFDATVDPHWLVVPETGCNTCNVTVTPSDAASLIYLTFDVAGKASVDPSQLDTSPKQITLFGIAKGHTTIEARLGSTSGDVYADLEICVLVRKSYQFDSHFMYDSATPSPHHTEKTASSLTSFLATLNSPTWGIQANLVFTDTVHKATDTIQADLGSYVECGGGNEWPSVVAFRNGDAPDVYFVWDMKGWDNEEDEYKNVDGAHYAGDILVADDCGSYCLAHEFGHYFGVPGDYDDPERSNELMYYMNSGGYKILHSQVHYANP
ncbi:MAG TPA: hypothetical protein PLQ35_02165 [bacterium]|nr:hypothetical protein [bacterium]HQL61077.1 hypothetical protein [bacterium]